ncbi:T9SS sorting signal type C domain-containing protein [Empedobacter falsenii]
MKKNLLALVALSAMYSASAQDTYIKDAVIVKVNPSTLFYNGGNVNVTTDAIDGTTEKIINEGNIQIKGGFKNTNETGKNFVNRYAVGNNNSQYGQLIISQNSTSSVEGKLVMQRVKPDQLTNDEYVLALPFKNTSAKDVINSLSDNIFKGDCAVNMDCGGNKRYLQSLLVWDIAETEYDAVDNNYKIEPYKRYLLNLRNNTNIYNTLNSLGSGPIGLAGIPSNEAVIESDIKSGWAKGGNYVDLTYGQWKNNINNYNQTYNSYLGNQNNTNDANQLYGKNLHRFGNPYTSNLDLSNVKTDESWITFNTENEGKNQSPTQVYLNSLRFQVFKISNGFTITWGANNGNTSTGGANTLVSAYLNTNGTNYFWTGNWQALLIKPYETFYIDYYTLNRQTTGNGSRIVTTNLNITDKNKTFAYDYTGYQTGKDGLPGVFNRSEKNISNLLEDEELKAKGLVTDFDFTQLELYLSQENTIQGSPAYLLNANFMETGNSTTPNVVNNPIFFYEEDKDGNILTNAQTISNSFNNEDYVGKPLRIGFNNLEIGKKYQLNLNLYEYSILNKVKDLKLGKYYLYDNLTNKVINVNESTELTFIADDKINNRFEFYWNELPSKLGTDDLNEDKVTYLYSNNGNQYVKFEQTNTTADISIFDLTGRQIFYKTNIVTNTNYKLNLTNIPNVYVVKIVYKDGKTVTKKTINK